MEMVYIIQCCIGLFKKIIRYEPISINIAKLDNHIIQRLRYVSKLPKNNTY